MRILTPLARARGLGSAKEGVHHWYMLRATSLLLILLTAWLLYAVTRLSGAGYEAALEFMASPINAVCAILLAVSGLYHAMLGMQVVIEDYVHTRAVEVTLQLVVKALAYVGMAVSAIYIVRLAVA